MKHTVTLKFGAAHNSITAGDTHLDFNGMTKDQRYAVRRALIEGLKDQRYFSRGAMKRNRAFRKVVAQ